MSETVPAENFEEFWLRYLRAHRNPTCRMLHYAASTVGILGLVSFAATLHWWILPLGTVASYGLAWMGHFFVEGNKPLAWTKPSWSLAADYRMFFLALTGRLRPHLTKAYA